MKVTYKIEIESKLSAQLWKLLTENFNCVLEKRQHSVDGESMHIQLKIISQK